MTLIAKITFGRTPVNDLDSRAYWTELQLFQRHLMILQLDAYQQILRMTHCLTPLPCAAVDFSRRFSEKLSQCLERLLETIRQD